MSMRNKHSYYLGIAEAVATRSTCLTKHYGAVIVKNDEVISTGYNGSPRGTVNCCDLGYCLRRRLGTERGNDYENACTSVHAEQNAIISAARRDMIGATLYLHGSDMDKNRMVENPGCCPICTRMIINSGIGSVVFADVDAPEGYRIESVERWVSENRGSPLGPKNY